MAVQNIVGLFESQGFALDARNRLKTEGVPERLISLVVLHDIAPAPRTSDPELAALEADPLVLGDVSETFARFTRNGETAVIVRAENEADVQFAHDVMALYAPLAIEVLTPGRRSAAISAVE